MTKTCTKCNGTGYVRTESIRDGRRSTLAKVCRCKAGKDLDLRSVIGACGEVLPRRGKLETE